MQGSQWKDNSASSKQQQLTLHIQCFHWKFLKPIHSWNKTFSKPQLPSSEVARMNMTSLLINCQCSGREQCLLYFSVEEPARDTATNWLLLSDFTTAAGLHKAALKVSNITKVDTQMLSFTLTTDAIAPFVWLDTQGIMGRFSDNGFIMVEPVKVLSFYAWDKPIYIDEFHRCLTVKSLMDMYK
ncbi:hypothetical protein LSAT2_002827 [Lamellibrachia satsuma]|nr:hypothetical protein LSAT2_002827 [Lamellibrachia satsuma]